MILDSLCTLSSAQDIHAASCASTYSYDCGVRHNYDDAWNSHPGGPNVGSGRPVKIHIALAAVVVASGAPTLQANVQQSPDNATWSNLVSSAALSAAQLTSEGLGGGAGGPGFEFDLILPDGPSLEYLQIYYTIGGTGGFTTALATAGVVLDGQTNRGW